MPPLESQVEDLTNLINESRSESVHEEAKLDPVPQRVEKPQQSAKAVSAPVGSSDGNKIPEAVAKSAPEKISKPPMKLDERRMPSV